MAVKAQEAAGFGPVMCPKTHVCSLSSPPTSSGHATAEAVFMIFSGGDIREDM
jgi:hypothetical protein